MNIKVNKYNVMDMKELENILNGLFDNDLLYAGIVIILI